MGLFETMLVVAGRVLQPGEHFARMADSSVRLGFPPPERTRFEEEAHRAAAEVADLPEAAVRCLWLEADRWLLHASAIPIPALTLQRRARGRAVTLDLTRSLPRHKLTSYAACAIGLRRAAAAGADEGLFVTRDGEVLEGTATNVFAVRGSTLVTAGEDILPGIVRGWVLQEAARLGLAVEVRPPSPAELREGGFLTGSLTTLAPLRTLDGVGCRMPGPLFDELLRRWRQVQIDGQPEL
jgi:branched-subunit amino acid aminotransferase/4-amino-4-deoxychorismate lyase